MSGVETDRVEFKPAFFDLVNQVLAADKIRASLFRFLDFSPWAITTTVLTYRGHEVEPEYRARVDQPSGIDAEPNSQLYCFVKLSKGNFLNLCNRFFEDCICGQVQSSQRPRCTSCRASSNSYLRGASESGFSIADWRLPISKILINPSSQMLLLPARSNRQSPIGNYSTVRPIWRAVPSMVRIAASRLVVFRSASSSSRFLQSWIWKSCRLSRFGLPEPLAKPAAFSRSAAGGVFVSNVNERSA